MQLPAPKQIQPQTIQADPPVDRPKKRRKRQASSSGIHNGVETTSPAGNLAESATDPSRVAGPSQSAAASIVPPPTLGPSASNKRQEPTPSQRAPPAVKRSAVRPSIPRPSSDVIDLREGGLLSFSVPVLPSQTADQISWISVPHPNAQPKHNRSSGSRAIHEPLLTTGPSLPPPPAYTSRPTVLAATPTTLPSVRARIPPPDHVSVPPSVQAPAPPIPARIPSPVPALALSSVHAPAPSIPITQEELVDAALDFLERSVSIPIPIPIPSPMIQCSKLRADYPPAHTGTSTPSPPRAPRSRPPTRPTPSSPCTCTPSSPSRWRCSTPHSEGARRSSRRCSRCPRT